MNYTKILLLIIFSYNLGYSQKGWELGGWLGGSHYFGDLNTESKINKPGIAGGVLGRYNFNHRVSVRSSLSYANVGADDALSTNNFEKNRNLNFHSHLIDWTNGIEFNFFHFEHGSRTHNKTPYLFGGFNMFYFNPTTTLDNTRYSLRNFGTEGQPVGEEYKPFSGGLVIGGGFKFDLNTTLSVNIEVSTRVLFTDYLDDVSTVFPDKTLLEATRGATAVSLSDRSLMDGIGEAGRQRGDTKNKDNYTFAGISILKYFGSIPCPGISKVRR